jgi:hypothetical protein
MYQKIDTVRKTWTPAAVATPETTALFNVKKGDRVLWAEADLLTAAAASTDCTQELGDGTDTDGFVTAANLDLETGTVGTTVQGTGALLIASGGKLYTVADTIDVKYTTPTTPGAVAPVVLYTVHILRGTL